MFVITKGLHPDLFFSMKSLFVEYNHHFVALSLFALQKCLLPAYFQKTRVSAVGASQLKEEIKGSNTISYITLMS